MGRTIFTAGTLLLQTVDHPPDDGVPRVQLTTGDRWELLTADQVDDLLARLCELAPERAPLRDMVRVRRRDRRRRRRGRKTMSKYTEVIRVQATPELKRAIVDRAAAEQLPVSRWLLRAAITELGRETQLSLLDSDRPPPQKRRRGKPAR